MKRFGPFRLDTINHCLWRADERIGLTPKAFDVLRYLVERADRLVTQDEILEALWPETYVNPEGVRKYILEIRKVLGDQPGQPSFIGTFPKRGYQFIAQVIDEQTAPRSSVPGTAAANIVGRDAALTQLQDHLDTARTGQRQVIFVTGEAGIGKTTLLDVFERQADSHACLQFARGQCIEGFGGLEAYYPMLEAVGSLVSRNKDGSLAELLGKQAPTWLVQFPSVLKAGQRDALQREILGSTRTRMVREICEALEAMSAKDPLIVILEDLHWADAATIDLISAFARRREPAKLLVIVTYRPIDVVLSQSPLKGLKQDLLVHNLCHEIAVERLEESDVAEYLANEFANNTFPSGLAGLIHHNSGGNALFMVAIVRDIAKRGLIRQDCGIWNLTGPLQEIYRGIPETLQEMLDLQFAQLSLQEQRILQTCSVAGERFSVWVAAVLLDEPPISIEETCDKLAQRQQFIRSVGIHQAANGADSTHYEFRHALYRQALYRGLSSLNRSKLHRSLGERLMPICSAGKTDLASEVALHFEEGRDYEQAARCLMLTSENGSRRFAHAYSIRVLQHALDLARLLAAGGRPELDIEILQRIGDAHYALGAMSDSASAYQMAATRAADAGLRAAQIDALARLAFPAWYLDPERGNQICEQALEVSRIHGDPLVQAQRQLAAASFRLVYDAWREEDEKKCVAAHRTIRELSSVWVPEDVLYAYVRMVHGHYKEALEAGEVGLNANGKLLFYLLAYRLKTLTLQLWGRFGEVLRIVRSERDLAQKNGEDAWVFITIEVWLRALCFDFEGVRRLREICVRSDTEPYSPWTRAVSNVASGYAEIYLGNYELALQYFAQVRDAPPTRIFFLHWHLRLHAELGAAEAFLHAGDFANALRQTDRFLRLALSTAEPNMQVHAWDVKSRAAIAVKDFDSATQCVHNALEIVDRLDIPLAGWQIHRTAWNLYASLGNGEKANRHRARAQELIMRVADSFEPGEPLRESFLKAPAIRRIFEQYTSA